MVGSNPTVGMDVCLLWVLSGRGPCDELITRPEESYRLWCVVVCDLETSWMRRPWPNGGLLRQKQTKLLLLLLLLKKAPIIAVLFSSSIVITLLLTLSSYIHLILWSDLKITFTINVSANHIYPKYQTFFSLIHYLKNWGHLGLHTS